jgi:hypothetical protein
MAKRGRNEKVLNRGKMAIMQGSLQQLLVGYEDLTLDQEGLIDSPKDCPATFKWPYSF